MATSVYSIGYMRGHHEQNQTRFFAFFALAIAGALGAAFAGNMLTLFFCYEALTLSTYPLVTHHRSAEAKAGGARLYGHPACDLNRFPAHRRGRYLLHRWDS